jgi:hypothetical protein
MYKHTQYILETLNIASGPSVYYYCIVVVYFTESKFYTKYSKHKLTARFKCVEVKEKK